MAERKNRRGNLPLCGSVFSFPSGSPKILPKWDPFLKGGEKAPPEICPFAEALFALSAGDVFLLNTAPILSGKIIP